MSGGFDSNYDVVNKISISFYVTNMQSDLQPRDLLKRFEMIRTVVDVYITRKRSRMCRRFGFVGFIKVKNNQELEKKLCEILFDNYHMFASLSKYKIHEDVSIDKRNVQQERRNNETDSRRKDE